MSINISYSTANQAEVLAYPGSNGDLRADQLRHLDRMRAEAQAYQHRLDGQGIEWGLSIPDALEHLIAGHPDSTAECAGNAYRTAMQLVIDRNASDPAMLGTYSRPATFFGRVGDEMLLLGVPADLLPSAFLFGGLPPAFPFIPYAQEGYPAIGYLPLHNAKPVGDAYRAVLDRIDPNFRYDVNMLIEKLDFEHDEWEPGIGADTLFFSLT